MLRIARKSSRNLSQGASYLIPLVLAVLALLVLAGRAQAAVGSGEAAATVEAGTSESSTPAGSTGSSESETKSPVSGETPAAGAGTEQVIEGGSEHPVAESPPPPPEEPPVAETPPPPAEPAPAPETPPAETPPAPAPEPPAETPRAAPVAGAEGSHEHETPTAGADAEGEKRALEHAIEATSSGSAGEQGSKSSAALAAAAQSAVATRGSEPPVAAFGPPAISEISGTIETGGTGSAHSHSASTIAAQGGSGLECGLSGLGTRTPDVCVGGWLAVEREGRPTAALAARLLADPTSGSVPDAVAGGGSDGEHGGVALGNREPDTPAPGPAPSGASGASGSGGSGVAYSTFFALAGLLLLAPLCTMRRLRLACGPWRTGCVALIPERPD
jgi:outer membrane biosynthesis protein TonB